MSVRDQPYIYEVKRHSNERHPLFYLMSFTSLYRKAYIPLTDIVIGHICYLSVIVPRPPIHPFHNPPYAKRTFLNPPFDLILTRGK